MFRTNNQQAKTVPKLIQLFLAGVSCQSSRAVRVASTDLLAPTGVCARLAVDMSSRAAPARLVDWDYLLHGHAPKQVP